MITKYCVDSDSHVSSIQQIGRAYTYTHAKQTNFIIREWKINNNFSIGNLSKTCSDSIVIEIHF